MKPPRLHWVAIWTVLSLLCHAIPQQHFNLPYPILDWGVGQPAQGSLSHIPQDQGTPGIGDVATAKSPRQRRFDDEFVIRFNETAFTVCSLHGSSRSTITKAAMHLGADIWASEPHYVDIRIRKPQLQSFLSLLSSELRSKYQVLIPSLQYLVDQTTPKSSQLLAVQPPLDPDELQSFNDIFFQDYETLEGINQWMHLLNSVHPDLVEIFSLGLSYEGRDIYGLKITSPSKEDSNGKGKKKKKHGKIKKQEVLVHGALHSREWISITTVCYIANELIRGYVDKSEEVIELLEDFVWTLVPILDVDGYKYTWTSNRMWRKNRQPTSIPFCPGIDLDRNFGIHWTPEVSDVSEKAIPNPCSEAYPGTDPLTAVEASLLAKYLKSKQFIAYLDFHSYSQTVKYPFAYSCNAIPKDAEDLAELGWGAAKAGRDVSGTYYGVVQACEGDESVFLSRGEAGGSHVAAHPGGAALDWVYQIAKVRWAYSIKLRDTGNHGFLLPKEDIVPQGEEAWAMVKYIGSFIHEKLS